jgi:hypothetical protein
MNFTLTYHAESVVRVGAGLTEVQFMPNLRRKPVFFDGGLRDPLLFREAMLNLHDLVVSDFDTRLTAEDWARILDPVVTVASDEVFFEVFSQDESSYGRVALKPQLIGGFDEWSGGTTNVDFTDTLAKAIGAMRSATKAKLSVDKEGFAVQTEKGKTREKKVRVPDSWLRGFLNVQAAMCYPMRSFELGRADLRNILAFLRTHKEREGPRALVLRLRSGEPVTATFEPWNHEITLTQSVYRGDDETEIRLWGRRRLTLLNRLIPKLNRVTVYLLGSGFPSFWVCDLGAVTFTLGVSGWTIRPFASSGLQLAAPREKIKAATLAPALRELQSHERMTADDLRAALRESSATVTTALALLCEQGRVMYDLDAAAYRLREVCDTPLDDLKTAFDSQREANAEELVKKGSVSVSEETTSGEYRRFSGTVRSGNETYTVMLTLDNDGRIVDGECGCAWFRYNQLRGGPCRHLLAARKVAHS